jgi:hypothetical protein
MRSLFTISGLFRGLVVLFLLRQIAEVRRVPVMTTPRFLLGKSWPVTAPASPARRKNEEKRCS